ncbi:MAG: ATP-binding cassette domain-containing protein, partial [Candidatus Dormibacteraeota bacterium]|nr:ATP-binding cassette domain-containing protein [Candidatus Dormibacteraeota bacterium]
MSPHQGKEEVLVVDDLRVRLRTWSGPVTIVDGVSFSVKEAESVALVGESGAGKSVSVRALLGLLDRQRFEVSGRIMLGGVDLRGLSPRDRRSHVTST